MALLTFPAKHKPRYDSINLDEILDETLREGAERCPFSIPPQDKIPLIAKIFETGIRNTVYGSGPKDPAYLAATIEDLLKKNSLPRDAKFSFILLLNCHEPIMPQFKNFPNALKKYLTISFGMITHKSDEKLFEKTTDTLQHWGFDHFRVSLLNNFTSGVDEESYQKISENIDRALALGINTIRINDSLGTIYPETMAILASNLRHHYSKVNFCLHAHNDRGLGLQNALVSLYHGFNMVEGGFAETGNRSGLPAIEILDLIFKERNITINGKQLNTSKVLEAARLAENTFMSLPDLYRPVSGLIVEQENMGVTNIPKFLGESRDIPFFLNSTGLHDATILNILLDQGVINKNTFSDTLPKIKDKLETTFSSEYIKKRSDFNKLVDSVMHFYNTNVLYSSSVEQYVKKFLHDDSSILYSPDFLEKNKKISKQIQ